MSIGNVCLLGACVALLSQAAPLVEIGDDLQCKANYCRAGGGQFAQAEQRFGSSGIAAEESRLSRSNLR